MTFTGMKARFAILRPTGRLYFVARCSLAKTRPASLQAKNRQNVGVRAQRTFTYGHTDEKKQ